MTAAPRSDAHGISAHDYDRALLNMLADFAEERDHLRDTQRAISNILADYAGERDRLALVQKAAMNILDDFGAEKARLEETQKAIMNVLEDFSTEKAQLEGTKSAVINILDDLAEEKSRLESTQEAVVRSEQAIRESLHEKEVLLREVHHRVKNNLQLIVSLLNLQARHLGDDRARAMTEESQNRIHSIALVHEMLYQSGELARINLGNYLRTLVQHLMESWIGISGRVRLQVDAAKVELPIDLAIPCGLIVNELVTNALKHAFPNQAPGSIGISISAQTPGRVKLVVADDGVGLPEGVDTARSCGLGLKLVSTLTRQLRGSFSVRRSPGTAVELTLPVAA